MPVPLIKGCVERVFGGYIATAKTQNRGIIDISNRPKIIIMMNDFIR